MDVTEVGDSHITHSNWKYELMDLRREKIGMVGVIQICSSAQSKTPATWQ